MRIDLTPQDIERFWSQVDRSGGPDACWPWLGAKVGGTGYGKITLCSNGVVTYQRAHRVAYSLEHDGIPDGLMVRHTCDNPPCCNPIHLISGTNLENMADREERRRTAKGERIASSILTVADVIAIRSEYRPGIVTKRMLAAKYGVSMRAIKHIVERTGWLHV